MMELDKLYEQLAQRVAVLEAASRNNPDAMRQEKEAFYHNMLKQLPAGLRELVKLWFEDGTEMFFNELMDCDFPVWIIGKLLDGSKGIKATPEAAVKRCDRFAKEQVSKETLERYIQYKKKERKS